MGVFLSLPGLVFCLVLGLLSCGGSKQLVQDKPKIENRTGQYDESFDPLTLNDDDLVIVPDSSGPAQMGSATEQKKRPSPAATKEAEGFRVQILATNNIETASLTEQEANARFESLGHKTYLVFEAPLYKIRIGDCIDRNTAEELRDKAKEYGYSGAFIVKTKVNVIK